MSTNLNFVGFGRMTNVEKLADAIKGHKSEKEIFRLSKVISSSEINTKFDGDTPIVLAVERNNIEIVKILLKIPGIDVNLADDDGETPIMLAIYGCNVEIVKLLLAVPGININWKNKNGDTPIMLAIEQTCNAEIVKLLLQVPGIDVNKSDDNGTTAIMLAVRKCDIKVFYCTHDRNLVIIVCQVYIYSWYL